MSAGLIDQLGCLRQAYGAQDGLALLRSLLREGPLAGRTALVSSFGAESVVLLDMVATVDRSTPVIFLDTGKLFGETNEYREELTALLGLTDVRVVTPAPRDLLVHDPKGGLWQRDPDRCCEIRKTAPLDGALSRFAAWISGRKRFQGGLRSSLPTIEGDPASGRIKLNPLAPWSADDVERYRQLRNLPAHPLAAEGYGSIGCYPCTRRVAAGEDPREGRWWGLDKTECGIHRPGI
jgi:phosphoadenosine phosphosulfate reductase